MNLVARVLCFHAEDSELFLFLIVVSFWVLWTTRNKGMICGEFMGNPTELLFKLFSYLQRWLKRLNAGDQGRLDLMTKTTRAWTENFMVQRRVVVSLEDFL